MLPSDTQAETERFHTLSSHWRHVASLTCKLPACDRLRSTTYHVGTRRLGLPWKDLSILERPDLLVTTHAVLCFPFSKGLANTILQGLSNFNILKTRRILDIAKIIPAVNQVEHHPYDAPTRISCIIIDIYPRAFPQTELLSLCRSKDIILMAHQPLGGRPVPVVRAHPDEPFPTEHPQVGLPIPCCFTRSNIVLNDL